MKIRFHYLICLVLCLLCGRLYADVVTYPGPEGISPSKKFRVLVDDRPSFVYVARVFFELNNPGRTSAFTQFDFSGKVQVEVIVETMDIRSVKIRPASAGIPYTIQGNRISFELTEPEKIVVEVNGNIDDNLVIFANAPETDIPSPGDENVLYFGPGVHYIDGGYGILRLKSNQTLYLAGGAVLRGRILAEDAENIRIRGRGILDGSTLLGRQPEYYRKLLGEPDTLRRPPFVHFRNCSNISVEGIILNDGPSWMLVFSSCTDVRVSNVKEFGYVDNSDGIDLLGSVKVSISDVFIRNNDDCIVIKGRYRDVEDITVTNSVLWTDRATALQIGHETLTESIKNVRFSDIDILEQRNRYIGHYAMGIFNGDYATISDITYENIRVENCERLISLIIEKGFYNQSPRRGRIENIYFKNIYSYKTADIHLDGFSREHAIRDITFENLYLNDQAATPELFANPYVYDITFKAEGQATKVIRSPVAEDTQYFPIDIAPYCNRSRTDTLRGDGKGWFDLGPGEDMAGLEGGTFEFTDIPFAIPEDPAKGAVILRSGQYLTNQPYASYPIKIGRKADYLFFLQATAFTNAFVEKVPPDVWIGKAGKLLFNQSPVGTCLWYYVVRYSDDGSQVTIPVKAGYNLDDWNIWAPGGWVVPLNGRKFYIQKWDNPYPEKPIESVKMYSALQPEVPVLLALTAGKK